MDRVDRKMKHILLVLREPFLDRIPSLCLLYTSDAADEL